MSCEYADCTVNCHSMYELHNVTITLMRDVGVKGHYNRVDSIQWEGNTSWKKKRKLRKNVIMAPGRMLFLVSFYTLHSEAI